MFSKAVRSAVAVAAVLGMTTIANAQSFPSRPITLMVGLPPGSAVDVVSRLYATAVGEILGQNVIVENRVGGGGVIPIQALKQAAPDGHMLLAITNGSLTISPSIRTVPYQVDKDVVPVANMFGFSQYLAVPAESPAKSVQDLLQLAKTKEGGLTHSTLGTGTITHLLNVMVEKESGTTMRHLPYTSSSNYLLDFASNRVDFTFGAYQSTNSMMKAKKIRYLASTGQKRSPLTPDVPTTAEAGFPGLNLTVWVALLAPAGTPDAVVRQINAAFVKASREQKFAERMLQDGIDIDIRSPEGTRQLIADETATIAKLVKELGIKID